MGHRVNQNCWTGLLRCQESVQKHSNGIDRLLGWVDLLWVAATYKWHLTGIGLVIWSTSGLDKILNYWGPIRPCWHISPWRVLLRESSIVSWTWSPALRVAPYHATTALKPHCSQKDEIWGSLQILRLQIKFPESLRHGETSTSWVYVQKPY